MRRLFILSFSFFSFYFLNAASVIDDADSQISKLFSYTYSLLNELPKRASYCDIKSRCDFLDNYESCKGSLSDEQIKLIDSVLNSLKKAENRISQIRCLLKEEKCLWGQKALAILAKEINPFFQPSKISDITVSRFQFLFPKKTYRRTFVKINKIEVLLGVFYMSGISFCT